ncbi:MAG: HNH endonuclease [Synergistaceae bacterium]|nr:HNH endonuclease [Synergistaceae bacterium]
MATAIKNPEKIVAAINKFVEFVKSKDGGRPLSFVDKNNFMGREENYKAEIAERARKELKYESWDNSMIGAGKILEYCKNAKSLADNLVYINQQFRFDNIINKNHKDYNPEAEQALYDVYKGKDEKGAFEKAVEVFGGNYDLIAYLFFIKDSSRFLPVSPGRFDKSLQSLGISHELSRHCSWENYTGFIDIVRYIQSIMRDIITDTDVRLIDAHSSLWVIGSDEFLKWEKGIDEDTLKQIEEKSEDYVSSGVTRDSRITSYFKRSPDVVKTTKARANGKCQLCGKPAPFNDKKGTPYLEVHHVTWLSRGGEDSINNTVALCPNCHARMHILDDKSDVEELLRSINVS